MTTKKKCIVTVKVDVTEYLPEDWEKMSDQEIIEYIGDSPEVLEDQILNEGFYCDSEKGDPYIVKKVERV